MIFKFAFTHKLTVCWSSIKYVATLPCKKVSKIVWPVDAIASFAHSRVQTYRVRQNQSILKRYNSASFGADGFQQKVSKLYCNIYISLIRQELKTDISLRCTTVFIGAPCILSTTQTPSKRWLENTQRVQTSKYHHLKKAKTTRGCIGSESVPNIIICNTINLFFKLQSAFC